MKPRSTTVVQTNMRTLPLLLLSACAVDTSGLNAPPPSDAALPCSPITYVLPDLPEHGQAVAWLDFDRFTASDVQLCMSYVAPNPASGRSLYIGDEPTVLVGFGPCGPRTELRYEQCQLVENPGRRTIVRLENRPWNAGCQLGSMKDIQLTLDCGP